MVVIKGEMVEKEENVLVVLVCAGFADGAGGGIRLPGTYNL